MKTFGVVEGPFCRKSKFWKPGWAQLQVLFRARSNTLDMQTGWRFAGFRMFNNLGFAFLKAKGTPLVDQAVLEGCNVNGNYLCPCR